MKRFLKHIGSWIVALYLIMLGLDIIVSSGLRKTDIRKYAVWNDIYNHKIDADLIIVGSSRAWCGYNTQILDSLLGCNSYNLGLDGHALDAQIVRYDAYKRNSPSPRVVIINTDFLSTFGNTADIEYEREQYFPYINDHILLDAVSKGKKISFMDRLLPFVRYFGYHEDIFNGILSFAGKKTFDDGGMYKGYRGNDYGWTDGLLASNDVYDVSEDIDDSSYTLLESFVSELISDGIYIVFVKSPVYSPLFEKIENIGVSDNIFSKIAETYSIPVLNYYQDSLCNDKSNFYNPSHLNKRGSVEFTLKLANDIKAQELYYGNTVNNND